MHKLDPEAQPLWQRIGWLPTVEEAAAADGPASSHGMVELERAASGLRAELKPATAPRGSEGGADGAVRIGSSRWLGSGPYPSIFVLGAREAGADVLTDALTSLPGVCGGPLRLFDDDQRCDSQSSPTHRVRTCSQPS